MTNNMNRRKFFKSASMLAVVPAAIATSTPPAQSPEQLGMYQVNCFIWTYAYATHHKYTDLWADPEPVFDNFDSAVKCIKSHKDIWDLNLVSVTYDITFYPDGTSRADKVGSFNYTSAGAYQWVDTPPHHRYDYDSV